MLAQLFEWFKPNPTRQAAGLMYARCVTQARSPVFYDNFSVPDTMDGRFDLIVLHVFLALRRLKASANQEPLAQALVEYLFEDMDRSLRELGVADTGVGKRIRVMVDGFYGRLAAYEDALFKLPAMTAALKRNVYADAPVAEAKILALVDYVHATAHLLQQQDDSVLLSGQFTFPQPHRIALSAA